ncbi:MAG: DNA polymerase domain-containing protein [Anaerolineae bacterium]
MKQVTGWLFDIYARPDRGIAIWLVGEDARPYCFHQDFEVVFYASGAVSRLRELWRFLRGREVRLAYTRREDLFAGMQDVVEIRVLLPATYARVFKRVSGKFPDLVFYDADIPLPLRFVAAHDVFMMARCNVTAQPDGRLIDIAACESASELDPPLPPFRKLSLAPDADPARAVPRHLLIRYGGFHLRAPLANPRELVLLVKHILATYDPDVIQTRFGDTWLFSFLEDAAQEHGIAFNPNRDAGMPVLRRKEVSFFNYGRAHYRGPQVHLRGRWHVDTENCMTYGDYGLLGAIEETRMTGLPVQEAARRSPGAGIAALQNITAMRRGVLVPYQSQKGEIPKSYNQLVKADRGGLVLQPPVGLFSNVALLDFSSMMASIMIAYNVSPETAGREDPDALDIPELGIKVSQRPGLMPCSLRPLRDKRLALKRRLKSLDENDPAVHATRRRYKAVVDALKWLTVVAYGRLGFANSTFGRINSHEVVSFLSRQVVTRAKLIAEERGFTVLHLYVDSIFITRPGAAPEDFEAVARAIETETRMPIEMQKVYPWFAFLASRENANISVANRFYGLAADGDHKIRGIALRRSDTPRFVAGVQMEILNILAKETQPGKLFERLPEVLEMIRAKLDALRNGKAPLRHLVVSQTLSRELEEYSYFSPAAKAARQLQARGKLLKMGQRVQFIHVRSSPGVWAWDASGRLDPRTVDFAEYRKLVLRAAQEVLQPLGVTEELLKAWLFSPASYVPPALVRSAESLSNASYPLLALPDTARVETVS